MIATTMGDGDLSLAALLRHGLRYHGASEVLTYDGEDVAARTFADVAAGAGRLASALAALGVGRGDRVATLCWNHDPHVEAYLAVPGMGAVLHPLNFRLTPAQLARIVAHADDRVLIADASLLPLLEPVATELPSIRHVVVVGGEAPSAFSGALRYEELTGAAEASFPWPELDERTAAGMCYTTGTTGQPKGVVYSHRSIWLHALATALPDAVGFAERDRALVIVPMFHVNAWGVPHACWLTGADMLLPREFLQGAHLARLVELARPTIAAGVPTVMADVAAKVEETGADVSSLRGVLVGGAAASRALIERLSALGVPLLHGWGMTETSPVATVGGPPRGSDPADDAVWRSKQGRALPGVELRICGLGGEELPWDGTSVGEIEVRGPWVTASYHEDPAPEKFHDGWLRTGDAGTVDPLGYVQLTDRFKDLIKSGGEWISSVELENELMGHPAVLEASVIGVADDRWQERPLACVVVKPGAEVTVEELRAHLAGRVARWWVPERWAFLDAIPKTSVGKFDKKVLRAREEAGELPVVRDG